MVNKPSGEFTEQSLTRLGEIYLNEKDLRQAQPVLERLENEADYPQNVVFAQINSPLFLPKAKCSGFRCQTLGVLNLIRFIKINAI